MNLQAEAQKALAELLDGRAVKDHSNSTRDLPKPRITMTDKEEHAKILLTIFPNAKETNPARLYDMLKRIERRAQTIAKKFALRSEKYYDECAKCLNEFDELMGKENSLTIIHSDWTGYCLRLPREWTSKFNESRKQQKLCGIRTNWQGYGIIAPY